MGFGHRKVTNIKKMYFCLLWGGVQREKTKNKPEKRRKFEKEVRKEKGQTGQVRLLSKMVGVAKNQNWGQRGKKTMTDKAHPPGTKLPEKSYTAREKSRTGEREEQTLADKGSQKEKKLGEKKGNPS